MNKTLRIAFLSALLLGGPIYLSAQDHPDSQSTSSQNQAKTSDNPLGGAPVGGGISILITLGIALATRRIIEMRKSTDDIT
jgi:hypothetical protein